jgi:hypothetical protein
VIYRQTKSTAEIRIVKLFIFTMGSIPFWVILIGGHLLNAIMSSAEAWYLGHWAEQYNIRPALEVNVSQ